MLGAIALSATPAFGQEVGRRISNEGCGRATGYAETNKIVTRDGRTHVAWLDSNDDGFRVRVRSVEHAGGEWSEAVTVGEAFDNHGGPALAIDGRGTLHVVYYPHHHEFRYRRSVRPNDSTEWSEAESFGARCTYPTLVVAADDTLLLTARISRGDGPWEMALFARPAGGPWERRATLMKARQPGYAHFQDALAFAPDHQTLHLSCRVYEGPKGAVQTVGALRSPDAGQSWQRADGTELSLPITAVDLDVLATGGNDSTQLRCGSVAVDAAGHPHVVYATLEPDRGEVHVAVERDGEWTAAPLRPRVAGGLEGWALSMPGGLSFTRDGSWHLVVTTHRAPPGRSELTWGHPSSELAWLVSRDAGESFDVLWQSPEDSAVPAWLPSLERSTGAEALLAPALIYTLGGRGTGNSDRLSNEVRFLPPRK